MNTTADMKDDGLSHLTFGPMLITDLFKVHNGSGAAKKDVGSTPYVAASFQNNGVVGYVNKAKYPGGWLSLVKDGDGGAGKCFYQPVPFWPSNHVLALEPKTAGLTEQALLCVAALITHQCFPKYSRGNAINTTRLSRQQIMMPVTTDADGKSCPDWGGLTKLGDELLVTAKERSIAVRETNSSETETLPELTFQPMLITDVFESMKASAAWYDKNKLRVGPGAFPYVSRSGLSNGLDGAVGRQDKPPNDGNAVTIGVDTQTVFYQPMPFYTSVKIQVLRHPQLSADNGPVLVALLREQMSKFQWGNGASLERLKATRIMVPVTTDANGKQVVDWDGMSRYGRALRVRAERAMDAALENTAKPVAP